MCDSAASMIGPVPGLEGLFAALAPSYLGNSCSKPKKTSTLFRLHIGVKAAFNMRSRHKTCFLSYSQICAGSIGRLARS